ncbi:MAG: SIS domain-containing protein, partial [Candidatus Fermentibacteria bacterium]
MRKEISRYFDQISTLVHKIPLKNIEELVNIIFEAYENGKRIFIFGNGGGSATSSHFVCDLAKGTATPGKARLKAVSLSDNVPLITAWANDTDYTNTFGEQLKNLAEEGDVVIGLSGSGMSPNVINAFRIAGRIGAVSVLLSGYSGGDAVMGHRFANSGNNWNINWVGTSGGAGGGSALSGNLLADIF